MLINNSLIKRASLAVLLLCGTFSSAQALMNQPASLQALPSFFEGNRGQMADDYYFQARSDTYVSLIRQDGFDIRPRESMETVRFRFVGINQDSRPQAADQLPGKVNYFLGNRPSRWVAGVSTHSRLHQPQAFGTTELVYRFNQQGQLEYDLLLQKGQDADTLRLRIEGADSIALSEEGSLVIRSGHGELHHQPPVVYQEINQQRVSVDAAYRLLENNVVALDLQDYEQQHPVVVDPVLAYSSFLGGSRSDTFHGVAWSDTDKTLVVAGTTATQVQIQPDNTESIISSGLLDHAGNDNAADIAGCSFEYDSTRGRGGTEYRQVFVALVAKIDPTDGSLVFLNFFGGCDDEQARDVTVDSAGDIYIVGTTRSSDMPKIDSSFNGGTQLDDPPGDAFIAKFSADGSALDYAKYIGGSGEDFGRSVAVDQHGYAYVVGNTQSVDMFGCTTEGAAGCYNGNTDAFMARISLTGEGPVTNGSYIGGVNGDWAARIALLDNAVSDDVEAYVVGMTASPDFPFGDEDDPGYSVTPYKTYVQGERCSRTNSEFVGDEHNCQDVFLARYRNKGKSLVASTLIGGDLDDTATGIALDAAGDIYISGVTASAGVVLDGRQDADPGTAGDETETAIFNRFPLYKTIQDGSGNGDGLGDTGDLEGYISKFSLVRTDDAGDIRYRYFLRASSFLRGSDADKALAVTVDATDNVYVGGQTRSHDFFPLKNGFKGTPGSEDVFLTKLNQDGNHQFSVEYSTLLGGEGLDFTRDITLTNDQQPGVALVGGSNSSSFLTSNATQSSNAGGSADAIAVILEEGGVDDVQTELALSVASVDASINDGATSTLVYRIDNNSTVVARQVRLVIHLPAGVDITDKPGTCIRSDRDVLCSVPDLQDLGSGGESQEVSITIKPRFTGGVRVSASGYSAVADGDLDNNHISTLITVRPPPNRGALDGYGLLVLLVFMMVMRRRGASTV